MISKSTSVRARLAWAHMRQVDEIDPQMLCCDGMRTETAKCAKQSAFKIKLRSWHRQNLWCSICNAQLGNVLCVQMDGEMTVAAYQIEIDEGEFHD